VQIPGGTIEAGETPEQAVIREAFEESGLHPLDMVRYLGMRERAMLESRNPEIHERHFFHLAFAGESPMRWEHPELFPAEETTEPIRFALEWTEMDRLPEMIAGLGDLLPELFASLESDSAVTGGRAAFGT
jgi:8-oxo-dGTP pyrophosphatase MutT (NUDIX family)